MAYIIKVNEDNSLSAPKKQRIMQRSKLVDTLYFLVNPMYNGFNMADFTVLLEYRLPASQEYRTEILVLANEGYKEYLKYTLPVDTKITKESGKVEIHLSFIYAGLDSDGNSVQRVRKTSEYELNVIPLSAWTNALPDDALSPLDQRIIMINTQLDALNDMNNMIAESKADDIKYDKDNNMLQLLSGSKEIGNKVYLKNNSELTEEGIPIVDFDKLSEDNEDVIEDEDDNVVEF